MRIEEREAPAVAGSPGITQGRYGENGNLELVAPDVADGFWVLWCNLDTVEHHAGAPLGRWSPGLHVPTGGRVDAVRIAQVAAGPDWLECVVLTAGVAHRWHWSPAGGFEAAGVLAIGVSDIGPLHQDTDGRFSITVQPADGDTYRLAGAAGMYPVLDLRRVDGEVEPLPDPTAGATCRSSRGEERVLIRDGALWHAVGAPPEPLHPARWVE